MKEAPGRTAVSGAAILALVLLACSKLPGFGKQSEGDAASASAAPSAPATQPAAADAVCKVEARRVWGSGANRTTGLTAGSYGGRSAVGAALGNRPHVLVIESSGDAKLVQLSPPSDSALARNLGPKDARALHRVSPAIDDAGRIHAHVDYRDEYANGRRRISCGAVGSREALLAFEGKPLIDPEKKPAKKPEEAASAPKPEPVPSASAAPGPAASGPPRPRVRLPGAWRNKVREVPGLAVPKAKDDRPKRELRDCRTVVDPGGKNAWGIGSELYGEPKGEELKWSMRLIVDAGAGRGTILLYEVDLPRDPDALYTFESPVAQRLADGSYVLATRYRGSLMAWILNSALNKRSGPRTYRGGYSTLPHFTSDALDFMFLVSQKQDGERYELRYGRIDGQRAALPSSLVRPEIEGESSLAEPTLARVGNQRWISYQAGKRREGGLVIAPVDANLKAVGKPYVVTPGDQSVYESHLFGLDGGRLLAVYITNAEPSAELVSEILSCSVKG